MTDPESRSKPLLHAVGAGLAGSLAMTACHEVARRLFPQAPRLDSIGRRGLARIYRKLDQSAPAPDELQREALAGDLIANAALFAAAVAVGPAPNAPVRGAVAGMLAGGATLVLTPQLGLGPRADRLKPTTRGAILALYVGGGVVAGLIYRRLRGGGRS